MSEVKIYTLVMGEKEILNFKHGEEQRLWQFVKYKDYAALETKCAALAAMDRVPVKRVNADQMRHVCLEANRHLDKYGAMAKEVNKLLGRIQEQPAPVVRDEHLLQSLETRINSLEVCERKGELSTQQAISLKAYRLAVHCLRSSATSDENSTDTTNQQFESLAKSE